MFYETPKTGRFIEQIKNIAVLFQLEYSRLGLLPCPEEPWSNFTGSGFGRNLFSKFTRSFLIIIYKHHLYKHHDPQIRRKLKQHLQLKATLFSFRKVLFTMATEKQLFLALFCVECMNRHEK